MVTVKQFAERLLAFRPDLQDKEIKVVARNGLVFDPEIKLELKDFYDCLNKSADNVQFVVIRD